MRRRLSQIIVVLGLMLLVAAPLGVSGQDADDPQLGQAASAVNVSGLMVSKPAAIVEMDMGKLKGEPLRLAWSPEGQLYLQTVERDTRRDVTTLRHYIVSTDGQPPKAVDAEPAWAAEYWSVKSAQAAPGLPSYKIGVEQRQEVRAGRELIVTGWQVGTDGRKLFAGTALFGEGGTLLAAAKATWFPWTPR